MKILWWRILLAGIGLEILWVVILNFVLRPMFEVPGYVTIVALAGLMFVGGHWVGNKAESHKVMQGAAVGIAAVAFCTVLTIPAMQRGAIGFGAAFWTAHVSCRSAICGQRGIFADRLRRRTRGGQGS